MRAESVRPAPRRGLLAALAVAGVVVGLVAEWVSIYGLFQYSAIDAIRDVAVGWSYLGAGLIAWHRRPSSRVGPLMITVGFTWFIGNVASVAGLPGGSEGGAIAVAILAMSFGGLQRAFQTDLIVSYPSGRLHDRIERLVVVAAYGLIVTSAVVRLVASDPATMEICPRPCPPNPFLLVTDPQLAETLFVLGMLAELAVTLGLLGILLRRWRGASPSARRTLAPVWFGAGVMVLVFLGSEVALVLGAENGAVAAVIQGMQIVVPFAFLAGLLRGRLARAAVGDLVLDLARSQSNAGIRDALARALGDPTLELAFPIGAGGSYVDPDGRTVVLPAAGEARMATALRSGSDTAVVLVHDPALDEDPELVEAAGAAAMFAIENVKLQLELQSQLEEVRASRARIVQAGDAERRRVERDLHDGTQQRLAALAIALRMARDRAGLTADPQLERLLAEAGDELNGALRELRDLARGIHPAILTEEGLGPAVETLAARSPVPVQVQIPSGRLPAPVEVTAYFVVCEALANVVKHSRANEAIVRSEVVDGRLRLEVVDDGAGGADAARGSGLRGLADRVAASGGTLTYESASGTGTRVMAEIPCA